MNWFYESGGKQQGPVSEAELDSLIRAGTITARTLVWREGLPDWQPLSVARPSVEPGSAMCASCGQAFPTGDLVPISGQLICSNCKPAILQDLEQGGSPDLLGDSGRNGPAWEQRQQIGMASAIWQTVQDVLVRPMATFRTMRREGGLLTPLGYAVLVGSVGGIVSSIYQVATRSVMGPQETPPNLPPGFAEFMGYMQDPMVHLAIAVAMPLIIALLVFFESAIYHLCLMLCGGANRGFETTFRVVCYSLGSAMSLELIPVCGSLIAWFWKRVCYIIGLAQAHETDVWRAVVAIVLPLVLCCVGVFGLAFAVVFSAAQR